MFFCALDPDFPTVPVTIVGGSKLYQQTPKSYKFRCNDSISVDPRKTIKLETFNVFKLFVANQNKTHYIVNKQDSSFPLRKWMSTLKQRKLKLLMRFMFLNSNRAVPGCHQSSALEPTM
ncbi:hypothetical protein DVH24_032301 [Malus domestica]|uniref:Uncharacterized protein n=1 Tax=Malus domestica TaxID=3750 RepID=A0A498J6Y2_MALDO|nr:hypothetical protein DVH24_032301 [Malus domestica]